MFPPPPETAKHVRWSVMLVGLPDELAAQCADILTPLVMVRAEDVTDALARLAHDQPVLTVACTPSDATALDERATDVGSLVVVVPDGCKRHELEKLLRGALAHAEAGII